MKDSTFRIRLISVGAICFALLLVTKLYVVQVVSGDVFQEKADRQYTRPVGTVFDRGSIFFQAKDGTLMAAASLKTGYTVAINSKILKNPEDAFKKINTLLELSHDDFIA